MSSGQVRQGPIPRGPFLPHEHHPTSKQPPRRDRGSDVELLARHFVKVLNRNASSHPRSLIKDDRVYCGLLRRHTWPGNVRELFHIVEAAMVVCEGDEILPEHLPRRPACASLLRRPPRQPGTGRRTAADSRKNWIRAHIRRVLVVPVSGHRGNAARILGISERNLYRKLREHGLLP